MTIHNFFVVIGYIFWAYILFYITVRAIYKVYREKQYDKNVKYIESFFEPYKKKKSSLSLYKISKITDDDRLFKLCCDCYLKNIKTCSDKEKELLKNYLTNIVDYKIFMTSAHNRLTRCLIIAYAKTCSLESKRINQFLNNCQKNGEAQRQWFIYTEDFMKCIGEEESRWNY